MNIEQMTLLEAKRYCAARTNCDGCILEQAGVCDECVPHSWALTAEAQEELAKDLEVHIESH